MPASLPPSSLRCKSRLEASAPPATTTVLAATRSARPSESRQWTSVARPPLVSIRSARHSLKIRTPSPNSAWARGRMLSSAESFLP